MPLLERGTRLSQPCRRGEQPLTSSGSIVYESSGYTSDTIHRLQINDDVYFAKRFIHRSKREDEPHYSES
jgi:hypothetical protein